MAPCNRRRSAPENSSARTPSSSKIAKTKITAAMLIVGNRLSQSPWRVIPRFRWPSLWRTDERKHDEEHGAAVLLSSL
jgi:hypothetical protein